MTALRKSAPAAVLLWLAAVALGFALAARATTEPPVWDALSYVLKSLNFWTAYYADKPFNAFDLPMTVRPPGTVLMAYPLGWSLSYHWFLFRSLFFPVALLISAVVLAGWRRAQTPRERWTLAALALALAGMPILYQFQANDELPHTANWGLVDGFTAGVAAVAAAAALRSFAARSVFWACLAAAAGGFTLWIKPAGLALMGVTGLVWLILFIGAGLAPLKDDPKYRRFALASIAAAVVIFVAAAWPAYRSQYFSAENIAFGQRVLGVLDAEYNSALTAGLMFTLLHASLGYVVPLLTAAGLVVAARRARAAGLAAVACLAVGFLFWLQTGITQIRYFLPFAAMAFVLVVPTLLAWISKPVAAVAAAPALLTTLLLFTGAPTPLQRVLGINLHTNDYAAENTQAGDVLTALVADGRKTATAYLAGTTPALRNLQAVWDYSNVTQPDLPKITGLVPTTWESLSTVRVEDLLRCDYLAIEPTHDAAILNRHDVPDFGALIRLFNAWMSDLTEADGVTLVSETKVRLLRITDHVKFEAAIARLEANYDLPQSYRDANPQRWWSLDQAVARGATPAAVAFHTAADTTLVRTIRAVQAAPSASGLQISLWIEPGPADNIPGKWVLFGHLVDAGGNILGNAQSEILTGASPTPDQPLRSYTLTYPPRPPGAVAVAFGFFQPKGDVLDFLVSDDGVRDWDGKRAIWTLPVSQ